MSIEYLCNCYDNGVCNGTRDRDACSCNGDERNCSFYPEKRKTALGKMRCVDCVTMSETIPDVPEEVLKSLDIPPMHDLLTKALTLSKEINGMSNTIRSTLFYDDPTTPKNDREIRCATDNILAILDELESAHHILNIIRNML